MPTKLRSDDRTESFVPFQEFWSNVRLAARFVVTEPIADAPPMQSEQITKNLKKEIDWLSPKTVEGFDPEDFDFLPTEERKLLSEAVTGFSIVAEQVSDEEPATEEQIQKALPLFQRIIEILRPYNYGDAEAFKIGKLFESRLPARFPRESCELRFATGEDSGGNRAIWIMVIFDDEVFQEEPFLKKVRIVEPLVEKAFRELKLDRWPYIGFRTVGELRPLPPKRRKK